MTIEKDGSCILDVGDHPWITHKTSVRYRDARRIAKIDADLELLVTSGSVKKLAPASKQLLDKIFDGAQRTVHLAMKCSMILQEAGTY